MMVDPSRIGGRAFWTVNNGTTCLSHSHQKPCQNSIPLWRRVDCFCLGQSAKPIAQPRNMLAGGFARGCVSNTKSGEGGIRSFPRRPRISGLAWSALQRGPPAFRGRQREPFFESWMRLTAPVQFDKRGCGNGGTTGNRKGQTQLHQVSVRKIILIHGL